MYKKEIRNEVIPFYKTNDLAHQIDHADAVCNLALELNQILESPYPEKLVILAAYLHDIHADSRGVHQQLAHDFVMQNQAYYLHDLFDEERTLVAKACLEHRGSYKGKFSSLLSEIISSADRGRPDSVEKLLDRSAVFGMAQFGYTTEEAKAEARLHIKDKYGRNGYAQRPEIYCKYFAKELAELMAKIEVL